MHTHRKTFVLLFFVNTYIINKLINMGTLFQENIELLMMDIKIPDRSNYAYFISYGKKDIGVVKNKEPMNTWQWK